MLEAIILHTWNCKRLFLGYHGSTISATYRIVSQSCFRLCLEETENVHGEKRLEVC